MCVIQRHEYRLDNSNNVILCQFRHLVQPLEKRDHMTVSRVALQNHNVMLVTLLLSFEEPKSFYNIRMGQLLQDSAFSEETLSFSLHT
jgi:hypothetical protein